MMNHTELLAALCQRLGDTEGARFDPDCLDSALRRALSQLSIHCPQVLRAEMSIVEDTQELSLAALEGFMQVLELFYPYETGAIDPPALRGCYQIWQNGAPLLRLRGRIFEAGTTLQVYYAARHQVSGLDGALSGSLPPDLEDALLLGAAGFAAEMRAAALLESFGSSNIDQTQLLSLGQRWQAEFASMLNQLGLQSEMPCGPLPIHAWTLE